MRDELMPVIDYTLYLVDNYDNPKKMAVDFETFCKNRANENENQKKYFRFITNSKNESR
ncbi:MAG: hypothetical protein LBS79_04155 [Tannerella sp.]|nr:hypothetical protein [Tannerella sp.]